MKKITLLLLSVSLLTFACKKKKTEEIETSTTIEPAIAKSIMSNTSQEMKNDIIELTQSTSGNAALALSSKIDMATSNPLSRMAAAGTKGSIKVLYKDRVQDFRELFFVNSVASNARVAGGYDFNASKGVYEWSEDAQDFVKTSTANAVVIKFPAEKSGSTNNAVLTLKDYAETYYIGEFDTIYNPTRIVADLTVNGIKEVDVDFSASFNRDVPTALNYKVYAKPFSSTLNYKDEGSSVSVSTSLAKDGESTPVISSEFTVKFNNSNKDEVSQVSGYETYRKLKISGSIDIASLEAVEEPTVAQLNQYIKLDLIDAQTQKPLGKLEFFEDAEGTDMRIVFTDGSTELAETYFQPVVDEVESFSNEL